MGKGVSLSEALNVPVSQFFTRKTMCTVCHHNQDPSLILVEENNNIHPSVHLLDTPVSSTRVIIRIAR